jgi:hypothetical protein
MDEDFINWLIDRGLDGIALATVVKLRSKDIIMKENCKEILGLMRVFRCIGKIKPYNSQTVSYFCNLSRVLNDFIDHDYVQVVGDQPQWDCKKIKHELQNPKHKEWIDFFLELYN